MPPTLRKRKAPEPAPAPPAPKKAAAAASKKVAAPKKATAQKKEPAPEKDASAAAASPPAPAKGDKQVAVGDVIDLDEFGGEVETNDGEKTTLKKLVDQSKSGVVLFTYPKASTPGCKFAATRLRSRLQPLRNCFLHGTDTS